MNYQDQKNDMSRANESISNAILIFLLLARLIDEYLPVWIFGSTIPSWFVQWYLGVAYILTVLIIWLNRNKLAAINIDRPFMFAVILGGFLYALYLIPEIGMLVGIAAGFMFWAYQANLMVFSNPVPYSKGTGLLILLTIPVALAPILFFRLEIRNPLSLDTFLAILQGVLVAGLGSIVFEEVLFRGVLWSYLRKLKVNEQTAFFMQAFLFSISHHRYLHSAPYVFWVSIPLIALLLGLMAWWSKSLTPSSVGHFIFNLMIQLSLSIF